jgi:hypothetical protein
MYRTYILYFSSRVRCRWSQLSPLYSGHVALWHLFCVSVSATVCCPGTIFRAACAPEQTVHLTFPESTNRYQIYCPKGVVLYCLRQFHNAQVSQTGSVHYMDFFLYWVGYCVTRTNVSVFLVSSLLSLGVQFAYRHGNPMVQRQKCGRWCNPAIEQKAMYKLVPLPAYHEACCMRL